MRPHLPLISALLASSLLVACGPAANVTTTPSPASSGNQPESPTPSPSTSSPTPSPQANSSPDASPTPLPSIGPVSGTGTNLISNNLGSVRLTPAHLFLSRVGESQRFTVEARDASGQLVDISSLSLEWTSSDPNLVRVGADGTVTAQRDFGNVVITVREPRSGLSVTGQVDVTSYEVGGGGGGGGGGAAPPPPEESVTANLTAFEGLGSGEFYINASDLSSPVDHTAVSDPAVASDRDGNTVVVWAGENLTDIYAQRFASDGAPLGASFLVSSGSQAQFAPDVAVLDDGRFVVAWVGNGLPGGSGEDIYARTYLANGSPADTAFRVNDYVTSSQSQPAVAINDSGDFVISWTTNTQVAGIGEDILVKGYNFDSGLNFGETLVNSPVTSNQNLPDVAIDADGDFVVTWSGPNPAASFQTDVFARGFTSSGGNAVTEFTVNAFTTNNQTNPAIAIDNSGDFVIAWESNNQVSGGSSSDIYARRWLAGGLSPTDEILVNTFTQEAQANPAVAMDDDGDFTIVWDGASKYLDTDPDIMARRFNAAGAAASSQFQVNLSVSEDSVSPAVALDDSGGLFIAFHGELHAANGQEGILGRRFNSSDMPR